MTEVNELVQYLLATPLLLFPLLVLLSFLVFAVLKRLLKAAAILFIATVLYAVLVEYFGTGTGLG